MGLDEMKMRVIITCPALNLLGGVSNYFRVLSKHFSSSVVFFAVGERNNGNGLMPKGWRLLKDYLAFSRLLRKGSYDLVHLNPSLGLKAIIRDGIFLLIAKCFGKKVIVFIRGWDIKCEHLISSYFLWIFRLIYFRADAFIVLAEEFKEKLLSIGCHKPIYIETTIVDDDVFKNTIDKSQNPRPVVGREPNFHILFLSRIEKSKGVYKAIKTYQILKNGYKGISMSIAGDGSELRNVLGYTIKHKIRDIEFCGYVQGEAKVRQYLKADIYFFPTFFGEGMPNSVLEAMAYGLPVITRPVGGLHDFFENGKMGYITDSLEPKVFAELISKLITNPDLSSTICRYNREFAQKHFASDIVAERIEKIYGKLVRKN